MCINSAEFFTNSVIGEPSFANYEIMSAVIDHISRVDESVSMDLGGGALNSDSFGGKLILPVTMSEVDEKIHSNKRVDGIFPVLKVNNGISTAEKVVYSCIIGAVPLALGILGIIICIKRRYL